MKSLRVLLLLLLPTLLSGQVVGLTPESPAPGTPAVLELLQPEGVAEIVASSPLGKWFERFDAKQGKQAISLPNDLEVLLVGYRNEGSSTYNFTFVPLAGQENDRATQKWLAYFGSGQPAHGAVGSVKELDAAKAQEIISSLPTLPQNRANGRWYKITRMSSASRRATAILEWLEENPVNRMRNRLTQLLAATFSELGDPLRTISYGRMTLKQLPTDAMTLNGVAFAMSQAEVDMNQGLIYADRALTILSAPDQLEKPESLTPEEWRLEIMSAQAATMDTKAVLLTKLERFSEARLNFDAALQRAKRDEIYLHYGIMLQAWGKSSEATEVLEKGLALNGSNYQAILTALGR